MSSRGSSIRPCIQSFNHLTRPDDNTDHNCTTLADMLSRLLLLVSPSVQYIFNSVSAGTLPEDSSQSVTSYIPSSATTPVLSTVTATPSSVSATSPSNDALKLYGLLAVCLIVIALVFVGAIRGIVLSLRKPRNAPYEREHMMRNDGLTGDGLAVQEGSSSARYLCAGGACLGCDLCCLESDCLECSPSCGNGVCTGCDCSGDC